MNAAEIKLDFFRKIDSLKGERLREAYGMILNYLNSTVTEDHWEKLSEGEKKAIETGLSQIQAGKTKPHADVMSKFQKRYGR